MIYTFDKFISFHCFVVYFFIHKIIFRFCWNCDKTNGSMERMKKYDQIHIIVTKMTLIGISNPVQASFNSIEESI